jgi:hypothetical protein
MEAIFNSSRTPQSRVQFIKSTNSPANMSKNLSNSKVNPNTNQSLEKKDDFESMSNRNPEFFDSLQA